MNTPIDCCLCNFCGKSKRSYKLCSCGEVDQLSKLFNCQPAVDGGEFGYNPNLEFIRLNTSLEGIDNGVIK